MKWLFSFLCFLISAVPLAAQLPVGDVSEMTLDDYLALKLPSLEVLLENAKQNPSVAYYDAIKEGELRQLKTEKRTWMKYFRLTGSYQYGQMNDNTQFIDGVNPGYVNRYSGKVQSWYNLGGTISFPLDEIFNRRNRIKQQESKIKAAEIDVERWYDELAMKVIDAYTNALQNLSLLKIKSEAMTLATAQYKMSETDFVNGKIDAQTLSRQKNIESAAAREYEETRSTLNNALLKLEILTHTSIINKLK